ncbi:MAG: sensor histidine kinase [Pseudomonadota bacterium]
MNTRSIQPTILRWPYFRHAWLIVLATAFAVGGPLLLGMNVPLPFLTLLVVVVIAASLGGLVSGVVSGSIAGSVIFAAYLVGAGQPVVTGQLFTTLSGTLLMLGLGSYVGFIRGSLRLVEEQLLQNQSMLADQADTASDQADERSAELELVKDRLTQAQHRLRNVTRRWVDTQETERRSLARELHDDIGQCLTALRINLESNKNLFASDPAAKRFIETSYKLVDEVIASVRELQLNLRPSLLDDLGLFAALREYVNKQMSRGNIALEFRTTGSDVQIDPSHSIAAYRIAQEIVSNIQRHAQASKVIVSIDVNPASLTIDVVDDGIGFSVDSNDDDSPHYGLASMRERAMLMGGTVEVSSGRGEGTRVVLTMPVRNAEESDAA